VTLFDNHDEIEETPAENRQLAEAMTVLTEMAKERGLTRLADLGNLPPLTPETKAKYLALARAREEGR
jgi:hypothetical protein